MKRHHLAASVGLLGLVLAITPALSSGRGLPKPVRSYGDLERETGLKTPDGLAYGRMAVDVGGRDWPTTVSFRCHAEGGHVVSGLKAPPATKVFDNVYYVGDADVSTWAIDTPEGIILLDSLTTEADAQRYIVDGLKSVGLDPKRVRYILISHEHGDHYGGAPLIKSLSGARVGLSESGWRAIEGMKTDGPLARSPRPTRDLVLTDGQVISLGGVDVTVIATPGHTPGTVSFILPVKEGGVTHMAAFWGGNGFPNKPADRLTFLKSIDHFAAATARANVDVELAVHGDNDDLIARLAKRRAGGKQNPFIVGRQSYVRFEEVFRLCSKARMAERGEPME